MMKNSVSNAHSLGARRHSRFAKVAGLSVVAFGLAIGGATAAVTSSDNVDAQVEVLPPLNADPNRPVVDALDEKVASRFAFLRTAPVVGVPEPMVKALGSGGGYMGKNLALAREISTVTGPAWVFPAADGRLCMAAPKPGTGINDGTISMGCASDLTRIGLGFETEKGERFQTLLVPDGRAALITSASAEKRSRPVGSPDGVASVELAADEALELAAQ